MKNIAIHLAVALALAALSQPTAAAERLPPALASWTGSIPTAGPRDLGPERGPRGAKHATGVLASWNGSIPSETGGLIRAAGAGGDPAGARLSTASRVLASWNGWSESRLDR